MRRGLGIRRFLLRVLWTFRELRIFLFRILFCIRRLRRRGFYQRRIGLGLVISQNWISIEEWEILDEICQAVDDLSLIILPSTNPACHAISICFIKRPILQHIKIVRIYVNTMSRVYLLARQPVLLVQSFLERRLLLFVLYPQTRLPRQQIPEAVSREFQDMQDPIYKLPMLMNERGGNSIRTYLRIAWAMSRR